MTRVVDKFGNVTYNHRDKFIVHSETLIGEGQNWLAAPILDKPIHIINEEQNIDRYDFPRYAAIIEYKTPEYYENRNESIDKFEREGVENIIFTYSKDLQYLEELLNKYLDGDKYELDYMGHSLDKYVKFS